MSKSKTDFVQKTLANISRLEGEIPQAIHGFADLSKGAMQSGKLDKRTKEIVALALAIADYSKGCMKYHLQSLIQQDLSFEELMEITAVVTYMHGGTGLISATKALKYFEQMQQTNGDEANTKSHANASFRDNVVKGYD